MRDGSDASSVEAAPLVSNKTRASPPLTARRLLILPFLIPIRLYQLTLSPFIGNQCRFYPTCSRYAVEAYELHGPLRGSWLTVRRLCRCHPFGGHGYDPPPLPRERTSTR